MKLAVRELALLDPVMGEWIAQSPICNYKRQPSSVYFENLARNIAYQQLAGAAAASIWGRLRALVDDFTPEAVLELSEEEIRGAGFSRNKMLSLQDLAAHVADGRLPLKKIARQPDEVVIEELIQVRGIGRWTAQMFLMSQCGRLDVWPTGDLGVRAGYAKLYGLEELPTPKELEVLGQKFEPLRSIAAWYCWRATDTITP